MKVVHESRKQQQQNSEENRVKALKFKSNTRNEIKMAKPESELFKSTIFVKEPSKGLLIFVDSNTENLVAFKKCINKTNYNGVVKYYRSADEVIDFLKTVVLPNKAPATADLIFCQFKLEGGVTGI